MVVHIYGHPCDMNPIVENVSRLAEKDWRDIYCI